MVSRIAPSTPEQRSPAADRAAIRFVIAANWVSPALARRHIRTWLGELDWPRRHIDELVLAVSEIISNSIEHGYGVSVERPAPSAGVVEVDGHVAVDDAGLRRATVTVTDHGRWREPAPGPSNRGRGTLLARACTEGLITEHRGDGTTVTMRSRPV